MFLRGFFYLLPLVLLNLDSVTSDNGDINTCSFYYWSVDWKTAVQYCKDQDQQLLCYKSKKEIDDIADAFSLATFQTATLELWLSSRNCSFTQMEKCLSLHIQKSGKTVWHYFQSDCEVDIYPFVCCINGTYDTTRSLYTSTTKLTSQQFSVTESSLTTTTMESTSSTSQIPFCKTVNRRGIQWPDSEPAAVVMPCPGNSTGTAHWTCENSTDPKWKDGGPDMRNCRSLEILNLKERFNSTSASDVISALENIFQSNESQIFGPDLSDVISLMTALPDRLFQEVKSMSASEKWTSANSSVDKTVSVIDRMVGLSSTWQDINKSSRSQVGTNLLSTVDGMGALLADSMPDNTDEQSIVRENMVLQVMKPQLGKSAVLPQFLNPSTYNSSGLVILEPGYDRKLSTVDGNVSLVFALYSDMSKILLPPTPDHEHERNASLNSAVVSVTVTQARKASRIDNRVRIIMEHVTVNPNNSACIFWDMNRNNWDTRGCFLETSNGSHSVCVCNHLTNFALLMDYGDVIGDLDQLPFHYITLVGCYLSIFCLAICVVVFSCYSYHTRHSWGLRYAIHRNLCICLLVANVVLVAGLDNTYNQRICAIVAGLLHYFFLAAFSWMFLEALHIYLLLVVVFASRRSHSEKYYMFGYGFPLIIVTITAIARPEYYGTEQICWLSPEKGTIWAFMGPVACILIMNTAALILAQYKASKVSAKDDKAALIKRWLRVTLILFPVLGITWLFGFLYLGRHFEVVGYLFAIFNSFQGVCIFVFHCLLDKKARNMVVDSFRKKTLSTSTGSSGGGTQKRTKEIGENKPKINSITPVEKDDNLNAAQRTFQLPDRTKKEKSKWHKPWVFCFELKVSDKKKKSKKVQPEEIPVAVVRPWNSQKHCS